MTTRKPTPPPPLPSQVVQAKPVAPPANKQVDLETIAYELREIRIFLGRATKAKQRGGVLLIIAGVIIFGLSVLFSMNREQHELYQASLKAAGTWVESEPPPDVPPGALALTGAILMVVGGSLQYNPNLEKSS